MKRKQIKEVYILNVVQQDDYNGRFYTKQLAVFDDQEEANEFADKLKRGKATKENYRYAIFRVLPADYYTVR